MINVLLSLNNLKTKAGDLDVAGWITVLIDMKKLSSVVKNKVFKSTNFTKEIN